MALQDILTLELLDECADARTFSRGETYFRDGRVTTLEERDDVLQADVEGTHRYHVELYATDSGELEFACDCPVGQDGGFCKHVVAVAMAWLASSGEGASDHSRTTPAERAQTEDEQIAAYLATLDEVALRALLLEAVGRDELLRDKLVMAARANSSSDLNGLRAVVKQATDTHGFLDWREAASYAYRLDDLAELLERRIEFGSVGLVELIEEAIADAEEALQQIDDSNGEVIPAIKRLQRVHLSACSVLRPEPVALARRLFEFQMNGEWDTFSEILPDYVEALGKEGLAAYRERVEKAWTELPALTPADYRGVWESRRHRVEDAMESLVALSGDIDAMVRVKAKNRSHPGRYLSLAKLCRDNGRDEEALKWAEEGLAAFPNERIDDLVAFCIEAYLLRGDADRVEILAWGRFEKQAGCEPFFHLLDVADKISRRDGLRERAMAHLWAAVAAEESACGKRRARWERPKRSDLVSIYLREADAEKMWEAFCGGETDIRLWGKVAAARGRTHHEDAIALYKRLLPHVVEQGSHGSRYDAAFDVVKAIRMLRLENKQRVIFGDELAEIRLQWKKKRNFQKLLDTL
ncbi:SWIM zinc finger domain-containing protein [Azoarcus sp. KH32C]|uniref:SWIM zinc finger family protein n=1 Tax=Azoarcus sp. KH32C TaxID=748247 RepID=UPI0006856988|nr:DUF6880 family protein [Azoarcus sp. KH32C]